MAKFSLIRPLDQPPGSRRLLGDLISALQDGRFTNFRVIVAYAKSGPLYRIQECLEKWRAGGKTAEAILGIDQRGTSKDALELALALFDRVYVTRQAGITFHPKIYLFNGKADAHAFIGSNNLTVGGTEKNFEAAVHLQLELPADDAELVSIETVWSELLPASCPATTLLDAAGLAHLVADGLVVEERNIRANWESSDAASVGAARLGTLAGIVVKPESPLPKKIMTARRNRVGITVASVPVAAPVPAKTANARGFAIQIKPHHNGEIFLSVTAALQNPAFFKWPFNGMTNPKKAGNPSYPQLDPDPVVNIAVFGVGQEPALTLAHYALNTVYYEKNSEIRITAAPLVNVVPEYSVMIMEPSNEAGIDYEITIHRPDSPEYGAWVAACNQTMPGGGQRPRKYGWF